MAFRLVVLCAALAVAHGGLIGAPGLLGAHGVIGAPSVSYGYAPQVVAPAITSQHSNILRSYGNLGQVSTYSKTIDTPYSSVRKSDVRVSNPGTVAYASPALHYGAPALASPYGYAGYGHALAPAYGAPVAKAIAPAGLLGVAYSAAPAVAHMSYSNALGINYAW